jgi:diacylglycerol kinase (ATP)
LRRLCAQRGNAAHGLSSKRWGTTRDSAARALLFLNPRSRQGGGRAAQEALRCLEAKGLTLTPGRGAQPAEVTREITRLGHEVDLVIAGGGDGTVNAVLEGVLEAGLPLGILPLGTANDLARTLGIPSDPAAAAAVIVAGGTRRIDVGRVNDKFFLNVASMGLSVEIARRLTGTLKRRWGRYSYPLAALRAVLYSKPFTAEVTTTEGTMIRLQSLQLAVGNGRYYGGGLAVFEAAAIDDQRLDFYSVAPRRLWQWPSFLTPFRHGRNRKLAGVRAFSGPGPLEVRTDPPLPVNTDGEITTATPARFELLCQIPN